MQKHTSVKILSVLLSLALIICSVPFAVTAAEEKVFSIATASDIHYYPESLAGDKREAFYTYVESHNCVYDDLDNILNASLASFEYEVENNGVKYIVLVGDLTTNGEYEGHKELASKLLEFEEKTGAVILVTPGNHDINNPRASQFTDNTKQPAKTTSMADFYEIYNELGFSDAYHQFSEFGENKAGSLSYSVKTEDGYRLILADGGKFTGDVTKSGEDKQETSGTFTPELLEWILAEAEDAKKDGETPILFTHWNLSGMNYFHEYVMQGFAIDDVYKLQEILADAGINYSFGGHQHTSDVAITYTDSGNPMHSVITPPLTQFPFSYRVTDFKKNSEGGLDVTFNQRSCDEYSAVENVSGTGTYPAPYKETGFAKQHGGMSADATEYIFSVLKGTLDTYIGGIRAEGSIVAYIEKELDIDIEKTVNNYLFGGLSFEGTNILSGANVMSFLYDLDTQLMEKFIYNKSYTYSLIKETLRNVLETPLTDIPCEYFIDTYGFGSTEKGGTLGEAILTVIAHMYNGNEDISGDKFAQFIKEYSGQVEFLDTLLGAVKEHIINDLLVDKILGEIDFNISALFIDPTVSIGQYVQMIYTIVLAVIDSGIFNIESPEQFIDSLVSIINNFNDVSLKRLINAVLGTGLISYGTSIDSLIDNLLEQFLPYAVRETAVYQAYTVIGGMLTDDTKDWDVTYTNNGPVEVVPTRENMQLPVNVTLGMTEDNSTSFSINWFTKYSVTGTDISITKKDGTPVTDAVITKETKQTTYTAPGFDVGDFAILPWTHEAVQHTVTVSGLTPDTEYVYTIGDFTKSFTCSGTVKTAPDKNGKFTFIHVSDTAGYIPSHFEGFGNVMDAADTLYPEWSFAVHTGSFVKTPANENQWSWGIDAAREQFMSKPVAYAAGANDKGGESTAIKYFPASTAPKQLDDEGAYYSFDYSNAHFAILNTNFINEDGTLNSKQAQWLIADLANSNADWKIIALHQSIYGAVSDAELRTQLEAIMAEYDVDVILQGSESVYVRTSYINEGAAVPCDTLNVTIDGRTYKAYTDAKGSVAVISGSANGENTASAPSDAIIEKTAVTSLPVFSAITIDDNKLAFNAYTVDGEEVSEIDSFAIIKANTKVLLGDSDLDGVVTSADARLALRINVGLEKAADNIALAAADADLDGSVTSSDARLILRASVGLEAIEPEFIFAAKL